MTLTMTPALRDALRDAIENEREAGWGDDADRVRATVDATPDGPIDESRFDELVNAQVARDLTDAESEELDSHVVATIAYFGLEHLAVTS
jgi:hypothetical protein